MVDDKLHYQLLTTMDLFCEISGDIVVMIMEERWRNDFPICASCAFQMVNRVSTPPPPLPEVFMYSSLDSNSLGSWTCIYQPGSRWEF